MKKVIKTSLLVIALVLLISVACVIWFLTRPDDLLEASISADSRMTAFEAHVEKPRMDRFLFGILPTQLENKLLGGELRFSHASPGAKVGSIAPGLLELSADGWNLIIETDGDGKVGSATRLVFPIEMAEVQRTLRCRPADRPVGYLRTIKRTGSAEIEGRIDGSFLIELAKCENAETGKIIDTEAGGHSGQAWPSEPLTLRGSFVGPATTTEPTENRQKP